MDDKIMNVGNTTSNMYGSMCSLLIIFVKVVGARVFFGL